MLAGQHSVRDPVLNKVEGRDSHLKLSCVLYIHTHTHTYILPPIIQTHLNNKTKTKSLLNNGVKRGSCFHGRYGTATEPCILEFSSSRLLLLHRHMSLPHFILKLYNYNTLVPVFVIYFMLNSYLSSRIKLCLYFHVFPQASFDTVQPPEKWIHCTPYHI